MSAFQANGGDLLFNSLSGNGVPITTPIGQEVYSDADITPVAGVYQCGIIRCSGTNTAQRKLVLPLVAGAQWLVVNDGTGFGLQCIGASGTGIVVATGKTARIWSDGVNILRQSLDSTIST